IEDHYNITDRAAEVFLLEKPDFYNASDVINNCVYPNDRDIFNKNLELVRTGMIEQHDLEYRWLNKNGNPVWISSRGQVIFNDDGKAQYLVGRISELGRKNKIDNITGLYREIRLRQDILNIDRTFAGSGFLLLIGVDNFKDINERYSKETGNETLNGLARCIVKTVMDKAKVYRMSGDEIVVFCKNLDSIQCDPAEAMYKNIKAAVDKHIGEKYYKLFYTIS
ncbi:MAG TPA: hypothetical protein DCZ23_05040, partial [Lachnospiraceae bacterium]|nr:hypothetical protein [Lachnospiraceae bacterium]